MIPVTHSGHVIYTQGLLSPRGRFYLVAVKQNNVPRVREFMLETFSLQSEVNNLFRSTPLMVCPLIKGPRLSCNAELVANTFLSFDFYDHRVVHIPHE
jgi:hypothetical protein